MMQMQNIRKGKKSKSLWPNTYHLGNVLCIRSDTILILCISRWKCQRATLKSVIDSEPILSGADVSQEKVPVELD